MLPDDLPQDLPTFITRFGTDEACRDYLFRQRWPDGFRCRACGQGEAWALARRNIDECAAHGCHLLPGDKSWSFREPCGRELPCG